MYENMKDTFILKLSNEGFGRDEIKKITHALDMSMVGYELTSRETAVTTTGGENTNLLVDLFLHSKGQVWKSAATADEYRSYMVGKYGLFTLTGKTPAEIKPLDVSLYFDYSQSLRDMDGISRASNETLNCYRKAFNSFYEWCCERHLLSDNPIRLVEKFEVAEKLRDYCDRDELEELRSVCYTPWEKALVETAIITGARRAELASMTLGNLDLSRNEIIIREGKGKKDRVVSINARCKKALLDYFAEFKAFKGKCIALMPKNTPLFPITKAPYTAITPSALGAAFKRIVARTSINDNKHITTHSMRHSCITLLLEDLPIEQVSRYAGHSEISTTQRYNNTAHQVTLDRVKNIAI